MEPLFAILPYLKTEAPLYVAGITFRSSQDAENLKSEEIDHLQHIASLFYLAEDKPISEIVYALLRLPKDNDRADAQVKGLQAAHTILTFLVTRDCYDTHEQSSLYAITPTKVIDNTSHPMRLVPGYSITLNWLHRFEIAQGSKLYPPFPFLVPIGWNLSDLQGDLKLETLFRGLDAFVRGEILGHPEQSDRLETILRAMSWYNRSFSWYIPEEEKVIYLAVALEILFHEEELSQKLKLRIQEELRMHLQGFFGKSPRLRDWVEQFYRERSNILHEGFAKEFRFVAGGRRPTEQKLRLDSLVVYGRTLLRMCIFNILHATLLAEEYGLSAWFIHDQERLTAICKGLDEASSAKQGLEAVMSLVYSLERMWREYYTGQPEVDLNLVHGAGKRLFQAYLEAYPGTDAAVRGSLENIIHMGLDTPTKLFEAYEQLNTEIGRGIGTYQGKYWPRTSLHAVAHFAKYAGSHHFRRKALDLETSEEQGD